MPHICLVSYKKQCCCYQAGLVRTFRNSWYKWAANFHFNAELIFGVHIIAQFFTLNRPHTTKQHTSGGIASS